MTKGLQDGLKHQTLLGVTGSGKSVTGESPVLVRMGGKQRLLPISSVIDTIFAGFETDIQSAGGSEYINMNELPHHAQIDTYSFNSKSGNSGWRRVTQVSRHKASNLVKTVTSCGRTVRSTLDHNFFVARNGALKLINGEELQPGDWLPYPERLDNSGVGLSQLNLVDYIEDSYSAYCSLTGYGDSLSDIVGRQKYWRVVNERERISLSDWRRYAADSSSGAVALTVGSNKLAAQIPATLPLTDVVLRFLGFYVAEGHATEHYITLSTSDDEVAWLFRKAAQELHRPLIKRAKIYDYQITSSVLSHILKNICGQRAQDKRLPVFWPQLSNQQLATLLSAYFAGDGWVDTGGVSAVTVSRMLASDLQLALLKFGIHARRYPKTVNYKDSKCKSWVITVSGIGQIKLFAKEIGFALARKQRSLENIQKKAPNTNVDLIPLSGSELRLVRRAAGVYQREVAQYADLSRAQLSLIEAGKRTPSRRVVKAMLSFWRQDRFANLVEAEVITKKLSAFLRLHWTRVKTLDRMKDDCAVYDFAVEENETFLTGEGGLFVHNTFSMANVIQNVQKPTLVLSHNKTLAAQLYSEFKQFFPSNAVHYFVSYFDYYQPEAYMPRTDTYIEKDSDINEEIDRLRHAATDALLTRRDVIIVASVSCIYGIGSPTDYNDLSVKIVAGERRVRDKLMRQLTDIQYQRNDTDFHRGTFRVRGDVVDVFPAGEELAYRIEFFGDEIERILKIDPLTGEILGKPPAHTIFPGSHYVTPYDKLKVALGQIEHELQTRLDQFRREGKLLEAQRLQQRTRFDLEMLQETGFVKGIENYSRYLTDRAPGEQPATLLDYYPDDYLLIVDESHMTIPQVRGMYNGDRARKEVLVEYGFRLPSALDNRPLTFTEFEKHINQAVYVSATPAEYELSRSPSPAQQVIRPTGLLDPPIEIRPIDGQIDDLIAEMRAAVDKHHRVLVTTLTKRMAEDLTDHLKELNIKVAYLHSDVETLERTDILRDLRLGVYDVLVGINLLREGLDLPEVSLVAILDADKEGFLRSEQALIQTVGRAARHVDGHVIMYADHVTGSMRRTLDETTRRRAIQEKYNHEHNITPQGIQKTVEKGLRPDLPEEAKKAKLDLKKIPKDEYGTLLKDLTAQMDLASANLEFEKAAELRDIISDIKSKME